MGDWGEMRWEPRKTIGPVLFGLLIHIDRGGTEESPDVCLLRFYELDRGIWSYRYHFGSRSGAIGSGDFGRFLAFLALLRAFAVCRLAIKVAVSLSVVSGLI